MADGLRSSNTWKELKLLLLWIQTRQFKWVRKLPSVEFVQLGDNPGVDPEYTGVIIQDGILTPPLQAELEDMAEEKDIWFTLLYLLPPKLSHGKAA